jgi:hypothetical protein
LNMYKAMKEEERDVIRQLCYMFTLIQQDQHMRNCFFSVFAVAYRSHAYIQYPQPQKLASAEVSTFDCFRNFHVICSPGQVGVLLVLVTLRPAQ